MEYPHAAAKLIAVCDKSGHTTEVLKKILKICGRDNYHVMPADAPFEPALQPAVLLYYDVLTVGEACRFPLCVARYESAGLPQLQGLKPRTFSVENNRADFTACNIRRVESLIQFEIVGVGVIGRVKLPCKYEPSVEILLAAAAAAISCGVPFAEVLEALNHFEAQEK